MKTLKTILIITCLMIPAISFAQSDAKKSKSDTVQTTYHKKTYRKTTSTGTVGSTNKVKKENAPVLEDNGSVNTTGIVDGNRSSTGRPGADTLVNYAVKKSKKTTTTTKTTKKKQP